MTKNSVDPLRSGELAGLGERKRGVEDVQKYLRRFGYVTEGVELRSGEIDDKTSEALRAFQGFNGLPETGEFNSATKEVMKKTRCGLPDMRNGVAFTTTCKWNQQSLTYAFNNGTTDTGGAEFQAVRNAFLTWSLVVPLTFREVGINVNHDIEIDWRNANDPDFNMVGNIAAHADFPPGCGFINNTLPRPVHFDDSENQWAIGSVPNTVDVESFALHEIGHILGLGHSTVAGAVMVNIVGFLRVLQSDDVDGIRSLYGTIGWVSLAGEWSSIPVVGRNHVGRVEIFIVGQNEQLYNRYQKWASNSTGWSEWESLGGE
jgi:hypothetical protein